MSLSLPSYLIDVYRRVRSHGLGASEALRAARVWDAFTDLELDGVARIVREEDEHPDPDFGPWTVRTEVYVDKHWVVTDCVGGFDESQVYALEHLADLMQAAVDTYKLHYGEE